MKKLLIWFYLCPGIIDIDYSQLDSSVADYDLSLPGPREAQKTLNRSLFYSTHSPIHRGGIVADRENDGLGFHSLRISRNPVVRQILRVAQRGSGFRMMQ